MHVGAVAFSSTTANKVCTTIPFLNPNHSCTGRLLMVKESIEDEIVRVCIPDRMHMILICIFQGQGTVTVEDVDDEAVSSNFHQYYQPYRFIW